MKKVLDIPKHVDETLITVSDPVKGHIKRVDIRKGHILAPTPGITRHPDFFKRYSKLLYDRVQKYPEVFAKGVLKLLKYRQEGIQVQLDDGGLGHAEIAKAFFVAFAEYIADNVGHIGGQNNDSK